MNSEEITDPGLARQIAKEGVGFLSGFVDVIAAFLRRPLQPLCTSTVFSTNQKMRRLRFIEKSNSLAIALRPKFGLAELTTRILRMTPSQSSNTLTEQILEIKFRLDSGNSATS